MNHKKRKEKEKKKENKAELGEEQDMVKDSTI